jgi:hypothetical protein
MDTKQAETPCASVDGTELMSHMREFARWVKLSGTKDELRSLEYVQRKCEDYGFRTKLILHDAYISLPQSASVEIDNTALKSITHSFSRPSPKGGLNAKLVYVGQGHAADFSSRDVRGCIALVDGIATPDVSFYASRAGALGQLHISPHELLYEMCVSPVWGSPSLANVQELPKTVITTVSQADGSALRDRLSKGEEPRVVIHAEVDTGWRKTPILVADIDGPDTSEDAPFVILSGHHDTWHFGVMDNGGANATMLETARLCATRKNEWRRGLRLCFWSGHSHGRYSGSAWYADEHWDELERRCVAHVNVDSTGGIGASELKDTASMSGLHALAAEAVKQHAGQDYVGKRRGRAGDESFGGIGVLSMFGPLSEQAPENTKGRRNLGWWWHTPADTLDKIDESNLIRDTRVILHAIWRLLTDPILPFEHSLHARDLLKQLDGIKPPLGDKLSLDTLRKAAAKLIETSAVLGKRSDGLGEAEIARVNGALLKACRALVPADYTSGDRFKHEPALPVPAWPTLDPIRRFAAASPQSEDAKFLKVDAVRARNRVQHALREAEAILRAALK